MERQGKDRSAEKSKKSRIYKIEKEYIVSQIDKIG